MNLEENKQLSGMRRLLQTLGQTTNRCWSCSMCALPKILPRCLLGVKSRQEGDCTTFSISMFSDEIHLKCVSLMNVAQIK